jgi:hypothetical protein
MLKNIISRADFTGWYTLPVPENTTQAQTLAELISQVQILTLHKLLGGLELQKFVRDINPATELPTNEKYLELLYGGSWEVESLQIDFAGMKEIFLGQTVYYFWLNNMESATTGGMQTLSGLEARPSKTGAIKAGVDAYRRSHALYGTRGQNATQSTAYNFIAQNAESFPDWRFEELVNVNYFNF